MLRRHIDFFAVVFIALAMLGFAEVRSWQWPGLDSIRVEQAIDIERCPITTQVLSDITSMLR